MEKKMEKTTEESFIPASAWWRGGLVFIPDRGTVSVDVEENYFIFRSPTPAMTEWYSTTNALDAWQYIGEGILWRGEAVRGLLKAQKTFEKFQRESPRIAALLAISHVCVPEVHSGALESLWDLAYRAKEAGLQDAVIVGYLLILKLKKAASCPHPLDAQRTYTAGGMWVGSDGSAVDNLREIVTCTLCGSKIYDEGEFDEGEFQEVEDVAAVDF